MNSIEQIKVNVSERLMKHLKIKDIILYGSWARNENKPDSDIDIVVILDEEGVNFDYDNTINKRMRIAKILADIKSRIEIDNIVYTKDEWDILLNSDNTFIKQIVKDGVSIS
jgi:predicted nucleotidyltransferase